MQEFRGGTSGDHSDIPHLTYLRDIVMFLSSRQPDIMSLRFRREVGIRVTAKQEIVVGALIIYSTGINPRDIFAVIEALGSQYFNVNIRSAEKLNLFWRLSGKRRPGFWGGLVVIPLARLRLMTASFLQE